MKVCFFNRSYWPDQAATGQLLTELAEDLVQRHSCDVSIVAGPALHQPRRSPTAPPQRARLRRETRQGVSIVRANGTRYSPRRFAGRAANYLSYFASAVVTGLGLGPHDIIVALTDPPIIGLAALWAARRTGAKFVFLSEDVFPEVGALVQDFRSGAVDRTLDRITRHLLQQADAVVAIGERMERRLVEEKGADPSRVHVIHNWADSRSVMPGQKDNPFARVHGLVDRFVLMHSGNVGLSQDLETLLGAADRLRGKERLTIAIVGDGSRRADLERMVVERRLGGIVRFFPYQPKEALGDSFATADAFLVSLKAGLEGYIVPSKVYGILAAGRPFVVAADSSSEPATIARDYGCGVVAVPGDSDQLAAAVASLYDDPASARAMGERARSAAADFDRVQAVDAYYTLFVRLAEMARAA